MSPAKQSVLVVGSGVAARMAAVAIARRLPGVSVTRLDTRDDGDPLEDLLGAARPSIRSFHEQLGIDEVQIVTRTRAACRLGTRVQGWGNHDYFRGHGHYGEPIGGIPFHQLWMRAHAGHTVARYDTFSVAAALASRDRFGLPSSEPASPFAALDYGLQLHLPAYRRALGALGRAAAVQEITGQVRRAECSADGTRLKALWLDGERRLTADLIVDASGRAAIARRQLPVTWVDWSEALPTDRLIAVREGGDNAPPPYDRLVALPAGWRYEARTPGGTVHLFGYASAHLGDADAAEVLHNHTGCISANTPVVLQQGRLAEPWMGNCVAIGAAAVALEPTAATALHLVCRHIDRLVECWPAREGYPTPRECAAFNRRMALEAERMRDFVQLPYLLSQRLQPFWRLANHGPLSPELTRDLALFRERGRLAVHDEDSFERDEWLANLIGLGAQPRRTDPLADTIPAERAEHCFATAAAQIAGAVETSCTHAEWLQRLARAAS
jgi:tryptophan 7-halogenase